VDREAFDNELTCMEGAAGLDLIRSVVVAVLPLAIRTTAGVETGCRRWSTPRKQATQALEASGSGAPGEHGGKGLPVEGVVMSPGGQDDGRDVRVALGLRDHLFRVGVVDPVI
jgi:hypothetical protein